MPRIPTLALATAISAGGLDEDLHPLQQACEAAGLRADIVAWDDPTVSWSRFDAVLLRSTWDYTTRLEEFLAWCERISVHTPLINPLDVVRWNTDKHYLGELAARGVPVIPSHYIEVDGDPASIPDFDEFVVKPCVGAGSRGARRFIRAERADAIEHARNLLAQGSVIVQPYLAQVDEAGETALLFFDGRYSHAIRKAPLLRRGEDATRALFAAERIAARTPSEDERAVAKRALDGLPFAHRLAYARADLLPSSEGPMLLELELTEPSLFFATAPGAAARFAETLLMRLRG